MCDSTTIGNYYTIGHLTLITGLTDRTIRNYIASGFLTGEKINGLWHFTPEQVETFLQHPAVRPSIQAKKNSMVYDFLLDHKKKAPRICMILDLPDQGGKEVAEFFCYTISTGDFHDIHFSFDCIEGTPRVILTGETSEVLGLVNYFYAK